VHYTWSTMSSSSSRWGCKSNNWLWLVNFLLLQPHPLLLLLIVDHTLFTLLYYIQF